MKENMNIPDYSASYWRTHSENRSFPALEEDIHVDTAVVGGGIAGILTAYLLTLEGQKVALLEGTSLMDGTTGFTTAKVTAQHDVMYNELIENQSEESAAKYFLAQTEAMNKIVQLISEQQIDCDFKKQEAILHAGTEKGKKQLLKEKEAYDKLNIPHEFHETSDLPFSTEAALIMQDQFHFHPVKFLNKIIERITELGGKIYENSTAVDFKGKNPVELEMRNGSKVNASNLIMTTHFPFKDSLGFYFSRLHPSRSYSIVVKTEKPVPDGMYLGFDKPSFSLRHVDIDGEKYALIGGEGHKTGKSNNTMEHYENLKRFAAENFGAYEMAYRWSSQDLTTLDKIPYIGQAVTGRPNVYVATGFKKWGMSNGMVAAQVLTDTILEKENEFVSLFDPRRSHLKVDDGLTLAKETLDDGTQFVKSHLKRKEEELEQLQNDEGAIIQYDGKKTGAYRDEKGELHLINPVCTHMKCGVEWNNAERSWDCPCHGSRFAVDGEVIEGPALKPLKKIEADKK
ncbi:FAD-dependent oxidoreductase [Alkalicoccus daliensis]|uniref:Glycine/D-amino acid oxidase n=1 Tax=Alkalicoccus daliensis TaxID=745820 RepID=A0A1H0E2R7_9BACI|nr:FAD-dependent oxidoreductase [Alkalicoccus daliensis]SDN76625.1 Glycine/D-amino acid oxidase [Alkalicoccus daliensis]